MNLWTERSIEIANNFDYLDQLFRVYPMSVNPRRTVSDNTEQFLRSYMTNTSSKKIDLRDNQNLIKILLNEELFPIKDSYVAYLRRDRSSIERNPSTVNRIASIIHAMGFHDVMNAISQPKETNRQIGPMFKDWVSKASLGADEILNVYSGNLDRFFNENKNFILVGSDAELERVAREKLGYSNIKGVDFVAKFNGVFVLGEAKFLTDFGGHQNAQMNDALNFLKSEIGQDIYPVKLIGILDGVNYIQGNNKLYRNTIKDPERDIFSALLLRDYLFSL